MTRPAHFSDWHTEERQAWLRDSFADATGAAQMLGRAIVGAVGIALAAACGLLYADWMTGVSWTRDVILAWVGVTP